MLKKCFIITQFGSPHPWTDEFVKNVTPLEKDGWYWIIFTPNKIQGSSNVSIEKMTPEEFSDLTERKLGVRPNVFTTTRGVPSVHMTDFYVFGGKIFEDYLKGFDYWGIANIDMVFGDLSKFLPDHEIEKYDIWTDEPTSFNGIFSLLKNTDKVVELYKLIPSWEKKISQSPCPLCTNGIGGHTLFATDEYDMTDLLKRADVLSFIKYGQPRYHPLHSHDRLEQHNPIVKLELVDGHLFELFSDINHPQWAHARPLLGKEIMYFHFLRTKEWPKCLL